MRQETERLREPAAWALLGFTGLQLAVSASGVFLGVGTDTKGFAARAYGRQGELLHVMTPVLLAAAVLLVTHAGRPTPRARALTRTALALLGLQAFAGLAAGLGALTYDGGFASIPASARVQQTLLNGGVLVLCGLCAYFMVVVLAAPSPPVVTRGRSLPHEEWARNGPHGPSGHEPETGPWNTGAPHPARHTADGDAFPGGAPTPAPGTHPSTTAHPASHTRTHTAAPTYTAAPGHTAPAHPGTHTYTHPAAPAGTGGGVPWGAGTGVGPGAPATAAGRVPARPAAPPGAGAPDQARP